MASTKCETSGGGGRLLTLELPASLRARIVAEARAAFPDECCGLIVGERTGEAVRAVAVHPTANLAADPAAGFEIDPGAHIRLRCALRGTPRRIVGCYHSHPNGRAEPSERDRAAATGEEDFVWIIAAVAGGEVSLKAFDGCAFAPVVLAR